MQERRKEIMRGLKGLPGRNPPRSRCVPGENSTDDLQQCLASALKGPGSGTSNVALTKPPRLGSH